LKFSFQKKEKDPNIVHGMKVPYAPAKRQAAKWRWYLILFIVSSPLLYFLFKLILFQVIVTAQGFISLEKVAVNSTSTGTIQKLYATVGQELTSGSMIARLYNADLSSQKIMLEAELSALDHPEISYDPSQEVLLRKRIDLIKEVLNFEQKYFASVNFLFNQGAATVAELDLARGRKTKAELDHYHARFELGRLLESRQKHPILPEIEAEKMRRQINAKIKALELQQARLSQTLPYDGRILDVFAKEGESVSTGSSLLLLGRSDKPSVIAYLSPKYAKYARTGQKAVVKLPNGQTVQAKVNTDSNLTKRLPADLSSPIGSRDLMLLVSLELESLLPDFQWVDGLPVSVRFQARIL
jgi:multidrug resistance efflux pump